MRRKDREIRSYAERIEVMKSCDCCRLRPVDAGLAYILPLSFGVEQADGKLYLYFHGASAGKKVDLIEKQRTASFEMDRKHRLIKGATACAYSYRYQSIMGKGTVWLVRDPNEKAHGLNVIMSHYASGDDWEFRPELMDAVALIRLEVEEWSCKKH